MYLWFGHLFFLKNHICSISSLRKWIRSSLPSTAIFPWWSHRPSSGADTQRWVFWGTKSQKEWWIYIGFTGVYHKFWQFSVGKWWSMMKIDEAWDFEKTNDKPWNRMGFSGFPIIFNQPWLLAGASKLRWRFAVFSIVAYASIDNSVAWDVEVSQIRCGLPVELWWGMLRLYRQDLYALYGYGSIPINTIFRGMNIHLPAILMFTRGTRFWHTAICSYWR